MWLECFYVAVLYNSEDINSKNSSALIFDEREGSIWKDV